MDQRYTWQPGGLPRKALNNSDSVSYLVCFLGKRAANPSSYICVVNPRHTIIPLLCSSIGHLLLSSQALNRTYHTPCTNMHLDIAPLSSRCSARVYCRCTILVALTMQCVLPHPKPQRHNRESLRVMNIRCCTQPPSKNASAEEQTTREQNKAIFQPSIVFLCVCPCKHFQT